MCHFNLLNFAINSISLQILTSTILQAYKYTQSLKNQKYLEEKYSELLDNNSNLLKESNTDELTKLFNRRGYLKYAQKLINVSAEMGTHGLVFFADLDGLKTINDTYGHKYGDLAIQTIASVLRRAFRQSDVVGRLSGDEFSIVAPGMNLINLQPMRKKIDSFCKELSKEQKLPFVVSVSMGAVPFTSEQTDVQSLLKEADLRLYEEKKIKHSRQKK